ncbi:Ig-like domain-containing protein [Corynebacterium sp. CCM 9204]|uniref:Ig-like domain-containing protein n=1 Tax=Corynebacterium sp. CCM 9204 TaxID=3057616 RepID=UPI003523BBEB
MPRIPHLATVTTVSLVGSLLLAPGAFAAESTTTTTIPLTCQAIPKTSLAGAQDFSTGAEGVTVDIIAPESVDIGEDFTAQISIRPVQINVSGLPAGATINELSRIKLDVAIPDGLTYLDNSLDTSDSNLTGLQIKRINERGREDENGRFLRVTSADNATIGNGPNASTDASGGVKHVVKNGKIDMRFPVVTLRFRAEQAGTVPLGVRTAGAAQNYGSDENFLTMLAKINVPVPFVGGTFWAPTRCTPRENKDAAIAPQASALATVRVVDSGPAVDTGLAVSASEATAGIPTTVTAQVTPEQANGTVTFAIGGSTVQAPVANGTATAELTFPSVGTHELTTTFTPGKPRRFNPSTSTTRVQVQGQDSKLSIVAPDAARADTSITVAATVDPTASGTIAFRFDDNDAVTVPVKNGRASTSLTVPTTPGENELIATFTPAEGSLFAEAEIRSNITITDATYTVLTLEGPESTVRPGEQTTIIAKLQPVDGTTTATGTVTFTVDGTSRKVEVSDNTATFTFTPDRADSFTIAAAFAPGDDTQTAATSEFTLTAAATESSFALEAPDLVRPFEEASFGVTVTPAADGTLTATHEGRSTSVPVTAGTATLPLTFTRSGTQPVSLSFTPAEGSSTKGVTQSITVEVTTVNFESASVGIEAPSTIEADTPLPLTVTVTPDSGPAQAVSGSLSFTVDGEELVDGEGRAITMPVSGGKSTVNLTFVHGGERTVTVTFTGDNGVTATGTHTVTVTGGTQAPGGSSDITISSGSPTGEEGTNPFSALLALIAPFWAWLQSLFAKLFGGSS